MPDVRKAMAYSAKIKRGEENRAKNKRLIESAERWKRGEPSRPVSPPQENYYSPPYAPPAAAVTSDFDYNYDELFTPTEPAYVPDSPPYAPAAKRSRPRRVLHAHSRHEREYQIEDEVDNEGNVFVRGFKANASFRSRANPGLMKTRTRVVVGSDPMMSDRYYSTEARLQSEHGPCVDDGARRELIRVLDMIRGVEATISRHSTQSDSSDVDEVELFEDLNAELEDLIQQKRFLFERCGFDVDLAFGRLHKAAKKTKSERKRRKYLILIHLLSL
jgi:hypothetical protein